MHGLHGPHPLRPPTTRANGNFLWAKSIDGTGFHIALYSSGNIYITGGFGSTADFDPGPGIFNLTSIGSVDIFVLKVDNDCNFEWVKSIGSTKFDYGEAIALDSIGNVYTTGGFYGTVDFDPGPNIYNLKSVNSSIPPHSPTSDIFISKLDNNGNFVWAKRIGEMAHDVGNDIAVDTMGNVFTTGEGPGQFNPDSNDIFVFKQEAADLLLLAPRLAE